MNTNEQDINFFPTRNQAKTALEYIQNGKFKDCGKDAPKGERWAVISQQVVEHNADKIVNPVESNEQLADTATVKDETKSKSQLTRDIVTDMYSKDGVRPRDIIIKIMDACSFNKQAASTYYYNAKRDLKL